MTVSPVKQLRRSLRPVRLGLQRRVAADPIRVRPTRGIVSFTFDDVPRSAYQNGAPILEAAGARGTFYVAAQLCDPKSARDPGDFLSPAEVVDLHRRGHQIGCHTYSHHGLAPGGEAELVAECRSNREALSAMLGGAAIEDFSFPFGRFSYRAKRALGGDYASLRSNHSGLNVGRADRSLLYSHAISTPRFDKARITALVNECARRRGWLIFYTHGVTEDPDQFSVTPEQFSWIVDLAAQGDLDLLTVADARRCLTPTVASAATRP